MAQGGGASASYLYEDDEEIPSFIMFLKSPVWLYPISRFLGHAIHCKYSIIRILNDIAVACCTACMCKAVLRNAPVTCTFSFARSDCRYEFDFLEQDEQQEERNLIIFGTYRDLVNS